MLRILFLLLAVFIGGWVAWPAYSAYQIYGGMKSADASVLERKINWDSMRSSLRPTVKREVEKAIGGAGAKGFTGALMPQIVDAAMKAIVTPKGLAQVMAHGGDISSAVSEIVSKQAGGLEALAGGGSDSGGGDGILGKLLGGGDKGSGGGILGGLLGNKKVRDMAGDKLGGMIKKKEKPKMADKPSSPNYGLANIKRFAYTGLGAMEVGVAKDPTIDTSDVVAVMEFQDFDWKLTGLVPRAR